MDVFFLGAAASTTGSLPSALRAISKNRKALDWQLQSLERTHFESVNFIGGYHIESVAEQYPQLNYTVVADWQHNNVVHSLLKAPLSEQREALVLYSDTLFRPKTVAQFADVSADVVVGVDSAWLTRFEQRSDKDINASEVLDSSVFENIDSDSKVEFTGLLKFSKRAVAAVKQISSDKVTNLLSLINHLSEQGLSIQLFDVKGDWTEFNSDMDIAHFILGTKSETLYRLYPLVKKSHIGEQVTFTVKQWQSNPHHQLEKIQQRFKGRPLVVRSSSYAEDCWDESHAGGFESVLNVDSKSEAAVIKAVENVVDSYINSDSIEEDQILVQACLSEVKMSGVVFTRSLETGAPYYRINFDDQTQSTESVTSGSGAHLRTIVVSKKDSLVVKHLESDIQKVLRGVAEIEALLGYDKLDIEFAVDGKGQLHIFQVRPIAVSHKNDFIDDAHVITTLDHCVQAFKDEQAASLNVVGNAAFFGVMPDWNPAEIIGVKPKPLAYSLYRHLIVDKIWAVQRAEFGYRDVSQHQLIRVFAGQPYVNIRTSLNSFIPATVSDEAAERICNAYLAVLKANPQCHDKLEFDVAFTVLTPKFIESARKRLSPYGVKESDLEALQSGLRDITQAAFYRLTADIDSIETLTQSRNDILASNAPALNKALLLLDECKKYGTLAFSHAARAGFVAMTFLNNLVKMGILSADDKNSFLSSFNTVAGEFELDATAVAEGNISKEDYVNSYGHLRPGTYDITAKAYWENPKQYLFSKACANQSKVVNNTCFELSANQRLKINALLESMKLGNDADQLMSYCKAATQARESVKFEFSKNLSKALDLMVEFGKSVGINRKKMAYLSLENLKEYRLGVKDIAGLKKVIKSNKKQFQLSKMVELPQLITCVTDFHAFERNASEPNFITSKAVEADSVCLSDEPQALAGKIVFIEQADPGYDWMFAHDLAGLITKYGGANSHMAIRSAELSLPAAIGVGDKIYDELKTASVVRLNCGLKQIIRIK
ncbi:PEP/pyruvate-binding domain-containing protein [Marinicella rhabdoformis]|uniref:PEP/pyruvate-binding domain-containing protein n=1 Tax=Marinicella rhabdoformis TaxID=2580566 RepID=UPI0012AEC3BB|nr:PEP/pyruvate-binding domain-containing protein [Marinicella rhabdoformis]